ncbi:MAG: TetR family transcriptional regulator C-terminal domain-containing protein [Pseudomonadota bacterium]
MKENTRDKLLTVACDLVRVQGFNNTGLGQILKDAGVPKGSFYHYFPSKDDLGYALIEVYSANLKEHLSAYLDSFQGPALLALRSYFESLADIFTKEFSYCNCLLGNFGQELAAQHDGFRVAIRTHFMDIEQLLAACFEQAKAEGDLDTSVDSTMLAQMLFAGWEGGLMRAKLEQSATNLDYFIKHFFATLPRYIDIKQ